MAQKGSHTNKLFWAVVADEARAIVYGHDTKSGPLRKVATLDNEVARMKASELVSDRGGRSFDSGGEGRHGMGQKVDPHRQAAARFAKTVALRISKAKHSGACRDFALVASPRFLGELRAALNTMPTVDPYLEIDKDMVAADAEAIRKLMDSA
ncbi:MAG: host attachment protein [Woeseiaceae bacterium]|nr:host attachment protein [Woeseiaceae bacterium]